MRICIFTPNFPPKVGGTEYVTDALAGEFHRQGQEVVVLAQGSPHDMQRPYRVEWFSKPLFPRVLPERVNGPLRRLHARYKFDVFLVNYAHPTGYAAVRLSEELGVPTIIVSHGGDLYRSSDDRNRPHLWKRTLYAYRHAHGLIAISTYIESLIREINPTPRFLELIPNGIDLSTIVAPGKRPADFTDTRPYALCLGNLGPMKGCADAIAAYGLAHEKLSKIILVIVGSGALEASLKQQVHDLKLNDRVRFLGKRTGDEKRWLLQNARFGVMPSIEEGHPIVGLEFLAVGKPLVCSTNQAFDGMFDDGVNSFRVPAQKPDQLAEALVKMEHADPVAMGAKSLERAPGYDWPIIARRYLAFIEKVRQG